MRIRQVGLVLIVGALLIASYWRADVFAALSGASAPSRLLKKSERRHTAPANAQTAMRFPYSIESIFR